MKKTTTAWVLSFAASIACLAAMFTESDWQVAFNNQVTHGRLEVETPLGRIDILTETHAIEIDHARNYRAGIKQALQYSAETKKLPGLALIVDGNQDTFESVEAAKRLCEQSGVTFWLINEHVSINDLAEQKPQLAPRTSPTPDPSASTRAQFQQTSEQSCWLNTKSGVRHNRSCRWFGNTLGGRPCGPDEGRPCKQCGG